MTTTPQTAAREPFREQFYGIYRDAARYADAWAEAQPGCPVGIYRHAERGHYLVSDLAPDCLQSDYGDVWELDSECYVDEDELWDADDWADHDYHGRREMGEA